MASMVTLNDELKKLRSWKKVKAVEIEDLMEKVGRADGCERAPYFEGFVLFGPQQRTHVLQGVLLGGKTRLCELITV